MNQFRTVFPPFKADFEINYQNPILSVGSCFAENIGSRLSNLKFKTLLNPFGILYNPISIFETIKRLQSNQPFDELELIENQGLWHSFAHHGEFSNPDKSAVLNKINQSLSVGHEFLKNTEILILTFGTAHVFEYKKTGKVVANCHKIPGSEFERRRLKIEEVSETLIGILQLIQNINPKIKIIFTVSPVRHIRDGLTENQKSKATLLLAIDAVQKANPESVFYFPAYEIVLDDLRDYRFFKEDLIHPNDTSIQYVWQYFESAFFTENTVKIIRKIEKINKAAAHRPLNPLSKSHRDFLKNQLLEIEKLKKEYPFLELAGDSEYFECQLI